MLSNLTALLAGNLKNLPGDARISMSFKAIGTKCHLFVSIFDKFANIALMKWCDFPILRNRGCITRVNQRRDGYKTALA